MKRMTFIVLGSVFLIGMGAAVFILSQSSVRGGETISIYSLRRYDPYGSAAFARLLETRGHRVVSVERPRLPQDARGSLIQIVPITADEIDGGDFFTELHWSGREGSVYALPESQILDWVREGNTLIQFARSNTAISNRLGVDIQEPKGDHSEEIRSAQFAGSEPTLLPGRTQSAQTDSSFPGQPTMSVSLHEPGNIIASPSDLNSRVLLRLAGRDSVVALRREVGNGKVIFIASPEMALNHWITQDHNARFLLGQVEEGDVYIDEWTHGIGHKGSIIEAIVAFGMLPVLFHVAMLIVLFRWSTATRQFRAERTRPASMTTDDQVDLLARLYSGGLRPPELWSRVKQEAVGRLACALRCPEHRLRDVLSTRKDTAPVQRAAALLDALESGSQQSIPSCPSCGYDIRGLPTMRCPECGSFLPQRVRAQVSASPAQNTGGHPARGLLTMAQALTQSHQLAEEFNRERWNRTR